MKIGFFGLADKEKQKFYESQLTNHQLEFIDSNLSDNSIAQDKEYEGISIFVKSKLSKKVIDSFPSLKFISVRSTGFDNVDIEYAKKKGIVVSNVPAYGSHTVAEFAFGLILSVSRKIPKAVERVRTTREFNFDGLRGFELFNKTLGVIGTGKIGANVIRMAKGFGMKVLASDLYPNKELANTLGFTYSSLEGVLTNSDIVTIHSPATPETFHLINKGNISQLKPNAILINTARGTIIETQAILDWLKTNPGAYAGLDVLEEEQNITTEEKELINLPNIIVTPHMAFFTKEAEDAIMQTTVDNILGYSENKPVNVVK